ncbi:MAG: sugar nucleotide-binding protein [Candidatus Hodarchaeales archaeon]|jgi:dTDP-4-dehydrorhamnose reductase
MIKIGVIGHTSRLGKPLIQRGCIPLDMDITKRNNIEHVLGKIRPHLVVNLAAHSDPDWCENNFDKTIKLNVDAFKTLCDVTGQRQIPVITLSTDHIFSGRTYFDWKFKRIIHSGPYKENYPRPVPVNAYGMSKLGMETVAFMYDHVKVVRTSYCFDYERLKWHIDRFGKGYLDQFPSFICRSFMHTDHFITVFMKYLEKFFEMPQTLHISGGLTVSWYDFMKALSEMCGIEDIPKRNKEQKGFAPRPHKAGLDVSLSKELGLPQFDYYDGLELLDL